MTQPAVADVLVIGSGASGAAVSWRLAGLGASVICLEQGDWVDRERLPNNHVDWEVRGRRFWAANPNVRRAPATRPAPPRARKRGATGNGHAAARGRGRATRTDGEVLAANALTPT